MNIEELKLTLEAIGLVSDNAQTFAYCWLAYQAFDSLLAFTCVMTICIGIYKFAIKLINDEL